MTGKHLSDARLATHRSPAALSLRTCRHVPRPPGDGEIHVWLLYLDHFHGHGVSLARLLDAGERREAGKLQLDLDRARFVARRGLRRLILGAYLRRWPGSLSYSAGAAAPPRLVEGNLCFSSSHAGPLAILTVAREPTGADIERTDQEADRALSRYCFDETLNKRLNSLPDKSRPRAFARFWTRGEAILKAELRRLLLPFSERDVFNPEWQVVEWNPAPGYVAAIAARGSGWSVRGLRFPLMLGGSNG